MTTLSLATILAESARRHPDKVAVVDGDVRVTYTQLWEQARAYAAGLRELGISPGDRVALLAPNVVDSHAPTTAHSRSARWWCRSTSYSHPTRRRTCSGTAARTCWSAIPASSPWVRRQQQRPESRW
jgi:acyl-CoA synthetase (AMP-forming)/AMP-acid ligase II